MADKSSPMSTEVVEKFLQEPRHAVFATNRRDGPPQLTTVWFLYEQGLLYVAMSQNSAKYKNIRRDPRVGICIPGVHPDARGVMMYGVAELFPEGTEQFNDINWRLVRRYYDSDEAARNYLDAVSTDHDGVLAVIRPDRVIAQDHN